MREVMIEDGRRPADRRGLLLVLMLRLLKLATMEATEGIAAEARENGVVSVAPAGAGATTGESTEGELGTGDSDIGGIGESGSEEAWLTVCRLVSWVVPADITELRLVTDMRVDRGAE
jgi:hypothetical protein